MSDKHKFQVGDIIVYRGNRFDHWKWRQKRHTTLELGTLYVVKEVIARPREHDIMRIENYNEIQNDLFNYYSEVHFDLATKEELMSNTIYTKNTKVIVVEIPQEGTGRTASRNTVVFFENEVDALEYIKYRVSKGDGPFRMFHATNDYSMPQVPLVTTPVR